MIYVSSTETNTSPTYVSQTTSFLYSYYCRVCQTINCGVDHTAPNVVLLNNSGYVCSYCGLQNCTVTHTGNEAPPSDSLKNRKQRRKDKSLARRVKGSS